MYTTFKNENGHCYLQWLITLLVNMASMTLGMQMGWLSPVLKQLQSDQSPVGRQMSEVEISWMASIVCLSASMGVPLYSFIADSCGRKRGVIAIAVPQALCWLLTYCAWNPVMLIVARALSGLAGGGTFVIIPLYVKEISQDNIRGLLGSLIILINTVGLLIIYAIGAYLEYYTVLWIVGGIPLATILMILKAPESPSFLVKLGKDDEAAAAIAFLRGLHPDHHVVQKEIEGIKSEDFYFKSIPNMSFATIFKVTPWRRAFTKMFLVMTPHGLSGALVVTSYAATLLASSGVSVSPELLSLSIPVVMILAAFVSMSVIERFGRKPVLITSFALAAVSMSTVGVVEVWERMGGTPPSWLTAAALVGVVAAQAGGISPAPYVIMAEMFNFQVRAKFLGCIVSYAWFLGFVQLIIFTQISIAFGSYVAYFAFGATNVFGIAAAMMVPETKGKTIDEIEDELRGEK